MKPAKHLKAKERLQQKAAANRAARLAPGAISEGRSSQDVVSGGAFKPEPNSPTGSMAFSPIQRGAYYVGSFPLNAQPGVDVSKVIEKKLRVLTIRKESPGVPIRVVILKDGIKLFRVDREMLFMAHALGRVSLSMGFRHLQLFAFVARNPSAQGGETLCHVLYCQNEEVPDEMSNLVSKAFQLAYVDMLSSKSHLAHAPKQIQKSISSDDLKLPGKARTPDKQPPPLPEGVSDVDVEEQQRLLTMFKTKKQESQRQANAEQDKRRTKLDEQRRLREEQQEKVMKRMELMQQRDALLEIKRQQEAKEQEERQRQQALATQTATPQTGTMGHPALKKRVVHKKGDSNSPMAKRSVGESSAGQHGSPALARPSTLMSTEAVPSNNQPVPPHAAQLSAQQQQADSGEYAQVVHSPGSSNVLPLPPRQGPAPVTEHIAEPAKPDVRSSLLRHQASVEGTFLPGGGFLPQNALRAEAPAQTRAGCYEDVNSSEEIAALVRVARQGVRLSDATEPAMPPKGSLPPPRPSKDGYLAPIEHGLVLAAQRGSGSGNGGQTSTKPDGLDYDIPPGTIIRQPAHKSSVPHGSASTAHPNAAPNSQKRFNGSIDPLELLGQAATDLVVEENKRTGWTSQGTSSPITNMDPGKFVQRAAELAAPRRAVGEYVEPEDNVNDDNDEEAEDIFSLKADFEDSMAKSDDEVNPKHAHWFQAGIPREIAMAILAHQPVGAFIVRESSTHKDCFALSMCTEADFAHFLIEQLEDGTVRFMREVQCFADLGSLISFYCHTAGPLPSPLSIVQINPNTIDGLDAEADDDETDFHGDDKDEYFNLPSGENVVMLSF